MQAPESLGGLLSVVDGKPQRDLERAVLLSTLGFSSHFGC